MLPTKRCGLLPVGRSTFSAQHWRAQAYATIFSCWISWISQQAKIESGCSRNSSSKDTVVLVEPDGHSLPGTVHLPSSGVKKRPIPHMPTFHSHPPQVPWLAPTTSWVFHMPEPSSSPTSATLLLEVQVRVPSHPPPLNFQLAPGGSR